MNDNPISFLLDTGAAVTFLREDIWNRLNTDDLLQLGPERMLVSEDGSPLWGLRQA